MGNSVISSLIYFSFLILFNKDLKIMRVLFYISLVRKGRKGDKMGMDKEEWEYYV